LKIKFGPFLVIPAPCHYICSRIIVSIRYDVSYGKKLVVVERTFEASSEVTRPWFFAKSGLSIHSASRFLVGGTAGK